VAKFCRGVQWKVYIGGEPGVIGMTTIYGVDLSYNSDIITIVMAELLDKGIIKVHKPFILTSKPVVNGFFYQCKSPKITHK